MKVGCERVDESKRAIESTCGATAQPSGESGGNAALQAGALERGLWKEDVVELTTAGHHLDNA